MIKSYELPMLVIASGAAFLLYKFAAECFACINAQLAALHF